MPASGKLAGMTHSSPLTDETATSAPTAGARDRAGLDDDLRQRLIIDARSAASNAYAPYSGFRVGAACASPTGTIHSGANVENASYGLTVCAERVALFRAVASGEREFVGLVVYTPTPRPTPPCGACRQVLCEFGDDIAVLCCCDGPDILEFKSGDLLPARFTLQPNGRSE
jgi:cytidine deaminase